MNEPRPVGEGERIGDLHDQGGGFIGWNRATLQAGRKRLAIAELHDDEAAAPLGADLVDRADVGVIERCGGLCLAQETPAPSFGVGLGTRDQLDRDGALERAVVGEIDLAHSARAEFADHAVVAKEFRVGRHTGHVEPGRRQYRPGCLGRT